MREAFQLACRAMAIQRRWSEKREGRDSGDLLWRPFQLAFLLMTIGPTCDREHAERDVMDLLWFPTGGGKTEAYLGLVATLLFYRRLSHEGGVGGAGVAAFMRYTLRLLTTQQFQRATALILACEMMRRGNPSRFGSRAFSIGLWVGGDAVANTFRDAVSALENGDRNSPRQVTTCPACGDRLRWLANRRRKSIDVSCTNTHDCELATTGADLPIWTVDEDVFRECPSLLIGTVDKYAQVVRKATSVCCSESVPSTTLQT